MTFSDVSLWKSFPPVRLGVFVFHAIKWGPLSHGCSGPFLSPHLIRHWLLVTAPRRRKTVRVTSRLVGLVTYKQMFYKTKDVKFGHTLADAHNTCEFHLSYSALTAAPHGAEKPAHFADGNLMLISIASTRQYIGDTSSGLCFLPLSFHLNVLGLRTTWFDYLVWPYFCHYPDNVIFFYFTR